MIGLAILIVLLTVGIAVGLPLLIVAGIIGGIGYGVYKAIEKAIEHHRHRQNIPNPKITVEVLKQDFQKKYHLDFDKMTQSKIMIEKLQKSFSPYADHTDCFTPNETKQIKKELKHEVLLLKQEIKNSSPYEEKSKACQYKNTLFHRKSKQQKPHNETLMPNEIKMQKISP